MSESKEKTVGGGFYALQKTKYGSKLVKANKSKQLKPNKWRQ